MITNNIANLWQQTLKQTVLSNRQKKTVQSLFIHVSKQLSVHTNLQRNRLNRGPIDISLKASKEGMKNIMSNSEISTFEICYSCYCVVTI